MDSKIEYNPETQDLQQIRKLQSENVILLCPICHSELVIALTLEDANRHKTHPGIFCPASDDHVAILVSLASAHHRMWDVFQSFKGVQVEKKRREET